MRTIMLAGASALALSAIPSLAQTTPAPAAKPVAVAAADTSTDDFIVVTGSRIARANLDASIPVTTLSTAEILNNGTVSLGDQLAYLPSFRPTFTSQNSGRFIGTAGVSTLDLRGQGTARTLVLQNGRRHVTSSPGANTVDVNAIPQDLLERVDIVTGGNSAVYGSDAIAGVVNFVTKRNFDGFIVRGQTGISSRGDRPAYSGSVTAGHNFNEGRGNIAVSAEFAQQDPLYFIERPEQYGAFRGRDQFNLVQDTAFPTAEAPGGDGKFDRQFFTNVKNIGFGNGGGFNSTCPAATATNAARRALNCTGLFNAAGTSEFGKVFQFLPDGTLVANNVSTDFRPFGSGNGVGGIGATQRDTGQLQTGTTRYAINLLGSYEISDAFRPFFEAKYVRTDSVQEGGPSFSSGALSPAFRLDNPFLTDQARALLTTSLAPGATTFTTQRINTDFGGRGENHSRDLYRFVAGVDGTFLDTWRYEVAASYGRVQTFYQTEGNPNLAKFTNAVNAVRNSAGQIVCSINADANLTNDDAACVPINMFGQGAPSQAALNYIIHPSSREQRAEQINVVGYVSGDSSKLFELPGGPLSFSIGGEWRRESSYSAFDAFTRGGGTFLNSIAIFNPPKLNVYEGFGEIRVPILKDRPFFRELTLEAAGRFSNYSVGGTGTVWTYNVGGIWSPVQDIRIRGSYARAIRAPTQSDLFAAQSQTFLNGLVDPCGQQNINGNPNRVKNCAAAGVPTTQTFNGITEPFTNRAQAGISGLSGGNPNLEAEKSNSYTIGTVIQPRFAPGFVLSVDYYNIDLSNAINTLASQTIVNECYNSPDGVNNQFCRALTRNPNGTFAGQSNVLHAGTTVEFATTGQSFLQGPFNFARQNTSGIDADISYATTFGNDWRFNGRAIVAYLINRDNYTSIVEPNRLTQQKFVLGDPEWNAQLRLNLGYKAVDFSWNARYVGKQIVAANWNDQNVEQGRPPTDLDAFPQVFYPDVIYNDIRLQVSIDKARVFLGVDNLFDVQPPLDITGTGAGSSIFTNTGRFYYMGIEFKF